MSYSKSEEVSPAPLAPGETAQVTLTIPCSPEYVGTARLTILGIASRMGFTYDQVEDIRLAVGEACANAIERSGGGPSPTALTIRCNVDASRLMIEVEDPGHGSDVSQSEAAVAEGMDVSRPAAEIDGMNSLELGALLMEILVDDVSVEALEGGGSRVRLTKYANEN